MAKSGKETIALLATLLATLGIAGGGAWLFFKNANPSSVNLGNSGQSNPLNSSEVSGRLSAGDRILIADGSSPDKQAGVSAAASGDMPTAIAKLEAALKANRNDPEALIYLNNARASGQKTYAIAASVPIGANVNAAREILRGVAQAQDEINQAGGINGTALKVIVADDNNDPNTAQQVADNLVKNSEVLGVVGNFGSDVTLAAGKVYQAGQLVLISPTSTTVQLSGFGNYIFRTVPSDRFAANALSRYMLNELRQKKAAVFFNSTSSYSKSLKDEFTTAVFGDGGQVVGEFDLGSSGFSAEDSVKQAVEKGTTVLMLAPNSATLDQALQVVTVNRSQLPILGGDSAYTSKTLQVGRENAVGMVLAVPWHIFADPSSQFPKRSAKLWGGDVNWRTALAYDATQAIATGLKQSATRTGLQKALSSPSFSAPGAAGQVQFQPSGDRNSAAILVKVSPGNRSGSGYDFTPIK